MTLKLYSDLFSPASRTVYLFLKAANVPFTQNNIDVIKGEHLNSKFKDISKLKQVPILDNKGFKIMESVAIMRYISKNYPIADHWYPKDTKKQAMVDEYLAWQHHNTNFLCYIFYELSYLKPLLSGKPENPGKVEQFKDRMIDCMDKIDTIWLEKNSFLAGDNISIADIACINDLDQTRIAGYDPQVDRPRLTKWMERVRNFLQPHYGEVIQLANIKDSR